MSFFVSPQAEYKAKRITQLLAPANQVAAQRDGRVLCNVNGHVHLFTLDENKNLQLVDTVDLVRNSTPPTVVLG